MTKEEIIDNIARLNSETWKDREEVRMEIGKLLAELRQALEQQHNDDVMAIHTQGLAEGIRCSMCTNTMKSDRGCDGGCVVDEDMYKKVMETINNQMFSQPTSGDCVSRQAVIEYIEACGAELGHDLENESVREDILNMPPVTPTQKWIHVSEGLPEEHEWIGTKRFKTTISDSVYVTFEAPDGTRFTDYIRLQNGKPSLSKQCELDAISKDIKLIAWMPSPKPYEKKRGSENE